MTHPTSPSRILDAPHLVAQTFGDRALEHEVLVLFEGQCERLLPLLAEPGAATLRADAAHTLKGAARAVGAWRIAEIAESLEEALRAGDEAAASQAIPELRSAIVKTRDAIEQRRTGAA
jgi:HPt (histidine-containing phosphotransfer) domain-containing protein